MAKFSWNEDSVRKVRANLNKWGAKKRRHLAVSLDVWAGDTVAQVQDELQKVGAFDQGTLAAATTKTPVTSSGTRLRVSVFNPLEYASVVEWGRRPGFHPPLLPLVGWAGRKGIVSLPRNISFGGEWKDKWAASAAILKNVRKGKTGGSRSDKPLDPVIRDLLIVRLIARKIFEKGSEGRHPFSKVFERRIRTFRRDIVKTAKLLT